MDDILVFDTETTTDPTQRLTFGWFRHCVLRPSGNLTCLAEGIIYADDLPESDPDGYKLLVDYSGNRPDVDLYSLTRHEPTARILLLSRQEFVNKWMYGFALKKGATVVGFNLPFDISRIASSVSESRGHMEGGFTFRLSRNDRLPGIRVKHLDNKKSLIDWQVRNLAGMPNDRGVFIDLRTFAFALTARGHSLDSACRAFGVERGKIDAGDHGRIDTAYIEYARRDVEATSGLLKACMAEYRKHDIDTAPHKLLSPASLAKAYYRRMGITPPMDRTSVPDKVMGEVMSTFYGGRAECHIRKLAVPVTLVDFTSMYPTVNALMGLWQHLTAETLCYRHATATVRSFLSHVSAEKMFNPKNWKGMCGIAKIEPMGDVVPVRARYGSDSTMNIGVNYLTGGGDVWYAIPDLVASTILSGHMPRVKDAILFEFEGTDPTLEPIDLYSKVHINPEDSDFFTFVIEERARVRESDPKLADFLKILANSGSYGIFAEMRRLEGQEKDITVFGHESSWQMSVRNPEQPGMFCYPPIATLITSGARLMLALLEHEVTAAGGTYAFCDTDSMAIVTGKTSHDVKSLSEDRVERIRRRFNALSPYRHNVIPELLKVEFRGFAYVVSAKRYALFDANGIRKYSEHGLGHLRGPSREWVRSIWNTIVYPTATIPEWFTLPALTQWVISTPHVWRTLEHWNAGKDYRDQIKPFSFCTICYPEKASKPRGKFRLITSFTTDPKEALAAEWVNMYGPGVYHIRAELDLFSDDISVKTYQQVAAEYRMHPETKAAGPDGKSAGMETVGELGRLHVGIIMDKHIGKESNRLEEKEAGLFDDTELSYNDNRWNWEIRDTIFGIFDHHGYTDYKLSKALHSNRHSPGNWRRGTVPTRKNQTALIQLAMREATRDIGKPYASDYEEVFKEWEVIFNERHT